MASPPDRAAQAAVPITDGRSARSARTRRAIVDGLLGLLDAGDLQPTGERIAEAAGVSVRSIFQHFADIESLFVAAAERQGQKIAALLSPIRLGEPTQRLEDFVSQRVRLFESIAGVMRATHLQEPFSAALQETLRGWRNLSRREIERVFAPELAGRGAEDRRELAEALVAVAAWEHWEILRGHRRLSRSRARAILRRSLAALLREPRA